MSPRSTLLTDDNPIAAELALSAATPPGGDPAGPGTDPARWLAERDLATGMTVTRTGLAELTGWRIDTDGWALRHDSHRFFAVNGVDVRLDGAAVGQWQQPIIDQPEIGILGILTARVDGVTRLLLQAKNEPGNPAGSQLSPTVQATRSNYTQAHGGRKVPYLDEFRDRDESRTVVDVLQSEQGSWFLRKRNRNMVVEVDPGIEVLDGFHWFTLAEVHRALALDNLVNMDTRTVLGCLPLHGVAVAGSIPAEAGGFQGALARSVLGTDGSVHRLLDIRAALTRARTEFEAGVTVIPLTAVRRWAERDGEIVHETGAFFDVVGVDVDCGGREVARWSQPMFTAREPGISCFLVSDIGGVLHALVRLRVEPGFVDVMELGPTVQCTPGNYDRLPPAARPPFLDEVLGAPASAIRFDSTMSEEGGRFLDTRTRYTVIEVAPRAEPPGFRWMTVHQLASLLEHSHYVNVQARSLVLCLQSLTFRPAPPAGDAGPATPARVPARPAAATR